MHSVSDFAEMVGYRNYAHINNQYVPYVR